ncbi:bifunctional 3-(3-hydroxy-phenyl)propionate/3-hydroxycinnamic acid hydroxylase [Nocardia sp. XZ_19_385]|uniref:bifunctional 3-(3-hydroxy-phenyl)propionate/3-hydroxycinnamic acid hydroxylase n=1 Tax=Nocardia sp. XZ_19_385 TaxID=2769488 RepID=UPI0018902699|nr:bifunctional 3-(3-hydroxy-phenyl)propionate/3-hydroxycinnamic acid hydroxylase [Nocardia sp. XZ_19_385]
MAAKVPTSTADVVVCGAGPVGLTAAALLAARGVDVVVLEQNAGTSDEPKAISIDDESLRVYQAAGIVDRVMPVVVPGTGTRYYSRHGKELFHARGPRPFRLGYPFKNPFAQPDLERALADALADTGNVEMRYGTRVVGFDQHPDQVSVHAVTATGRSVVHARYVLGCDGGRSATRLLQHIDMTGRSYPDVWLVVDTLEDPHTQRFAMHHGDPVRPHVIVPGLNGRCRYEFRLFDGEGTPEEKPDFALIERLVAPYRPISPHQVERAINYRFNAVVADQWMIGRSFLLGDAAHMMPPFAGQGLNSGLRDAANLAWKITDVLAGRLDPSILATYQQERYPHALATVRLSERLGRVVMTTSPRFARRRDQHIERTLATVRGRAFLEEMRYRPPTRYETGLLAAGDRPELVGIPIGQPLVFDAVTHRLCRFDDVLGNGWALLGIDVDQTDWTEVASILEQLDAAPIQVSTTEHMPRADHRVVIDVDGALVREFVHYTGRFALIRPDRVVAAAWSPADSADLVEQVRSWTPAGTASITSPERALTHG